VGEKQKGIELGVFQADTDAVLDTLTACCSSGTVGEKQKGIELGAFQANTYPSLRPGRLARWKG
jgi:hypothetical protein